MTDASQQKRRIAPATIALALAALLALVAIVIAATRSGEPSGFAASAAASPGNGMAGGGQTASVDQMIASLRQRVAQDPDNAEAWYLLGLTLRDSELYPDAEQAFRRAMQLQPNNPDHVAGLGEALLLVGREDPPREAQALFRRALELRRDHPQSRYYLAVLKDIEGNHRQAVDELIALLNDAPAGAAWVGQVRGAVQAIARQNNLDIAGRLPPEQPGAQATAAIPGPTREQMEAARAIPPAQQDQMVKAMVDRLQARLQQNPRDERGWTMLMRSRMVQGDRAGAAQALRSAVAAFGDDAAAQQRLRAAAQQLSVPAG
jgi:cytochrome c-type biogenesis protein CcmH